MTTSNVDWGKLFRERRRERRRRGLVLWLLLIATFNTAAIVAFAAKSDTTGCIIGGAGFSLMILIVIAIQLEEVIRRLPQPPAD